MLKKMVLILIVISKSLTLAAMYNKPPSENEIIIRAFSEAYKEFIEIYDKKMNDTDNKTLAAKILEIKRFRSSFKSKLTKLENAVRDENSKKEDNQKLIKELLTKMKEHTVFLKNAHEEYLTSEALRQFINGIKMKQELYNQEQQSSGQQSFMQRWVESAEKVRVSAEKVREEAYRKRLEADKEIEQYNEDEDEGIASSRFGDLCSIQ